MSKKWAELRSWSYERWQKLPSWLDECWGKSWLRKRWEESQPWLRRHPDGAEFLWYALVLVVVGSILLVLYILFAGRESYPRVVGGVQALLLALAFGAAAYYARAAREQVEVTRSLVSRAFPFITEPIETVQDYVGKGHTSAGLGCDKYDWLMIEITNEGQGPLMNVDVCANWIKDSYEKGPEARPSGSMKLLAEFSKFNGKEKKVWRQWRLSPDEPRLFYFRDPPEPHGVKAGRKLRIRWYDVHYEAWESEIKVWFRKDEDTWYTSWDQAMPRRR